MFPDTLMVGMEIRLKVRIRGFCVQFYSFCACAQMFLGAFMLCELANQKCLIDKTDHLKELLLRNRFGGRKIVFHSLLKTLFNESRELL